MFQACKTQKKNWAFPHVESHDRAALHGVGLPAGSAVRLVAGPPYAYRPGRPAIRSCSPSGPPNARHEKSIRSRLLLAPAESSGGKSNTLDLNFSTLQIGPVSNHSWVPPQQCMVSQPLCQGGHPGGGSGGPVSSRAGARGIPPPLEHHLSYQNSISLKSTLQTSTAPVSGSGRTAPCFSPTRATRTAWPG